MGGYSAALNWSSHDLRKCYTSNIKKLSESTGASEFFDQMLFLTLPSILCLLSLYLCQEK